MTFQLQLQQYSRSDLQAMKPAIFQKLADCLPSIAFQQDRSYTVSQIIHIIHSHLKKLSIPPIPDWWMRLPETPLQFGTRLHKLLSLSFDHLRSQNEFFNQKIIGNDQDTISKVLFQKIYDHVIQPEILQALASNTKSADKIALVGVAVQEWVKHLAEILSRYPQDQTFNAPLFFIASEHCAHTEIELFPHPNHRSLKIRGQMDAILYDYLEDCLVVYEYKCGAQRTYIASLLQCILYHEIIARSCGKELPLEAVIAVFAPSDNRIQDVIGHEEVAEKPVSSFPNSTLDNVEKEAHQLLNSVIEILSDYRLQASAKNCLVGPRFMQLQIYPEGSTTVTQIQNKSKDLQVKLQLPSPPRIAADQGFVAVEVERKHPEKVLLKDEIFSNPPLDKDFHCQCPLGLDIRGQAVWIDFADHNSCHFLVGGTTGSGKSVFLQSIIQYLQKHYGTEQLRLLIIDPKQITFSMFNSTPHLLKPIVCTREEAIQSLELLVAGMNERYKRFYSQKGVMDLSGWNAKNPKDSIPRWIVIFDEYADYMSDKQFRESIESSVERLGYMARAAGIHLVIALQRPDSKNVSGRIKSNLPGRIAFRTASSMESRIILDEKGAEDLFGKGDLLAKCGPQLIRAQGPLI